MKILFIGNSYTARNDLPLLIAQLAQAAGHKLESEQILVNGASLRLHWNAKRADAIRAQKWDYVVLQEQSTLPIKNATRFGENARLFDEVIRESGAKTLLYLTWARQNAPETQDVLKQSITQIAQEIGAKVAPVGIAWQTVLHENPELVLHDKDGSHPNFAGSHLAACVFFATLFGTTPQGLTIPNATQITESEATILQEIAWRVVSEFAI